MFKPARYRAEHKLSNGRELNSSLNQTNNYAR